MTGSILFRITKSREKESQSRGFWVPGTTILRNTAADSHSFVWRNGRRELYFFPEGQAAGPARMVVVSHGLMKESAVPDAEIRRAIERKQRFEAHPERHTFSPEGEA